MIVYMICINKEQCVRTMYVSRILEGRVQQKNCWRGDSHDPATMLGEFGNLICKLELGWSASASGSLGLANGSHRSSHAKSSKYCQGAVPTYLGTCT